MNRGRVLGLYGRGRLCWPSDGSGRMDWGRLAGVTAGGACGWARQKVGEERAGGDGCYRGARLCVGLSRLPLGL